MKFYKCTIAANELIIDKNVERIIIERIYILLQMLILSIAFGVVVYISASGKISTHKLFLITSCFAAVIFLIFFQNFFQKRKIRIKKENEFVLLNNKCIGKICSIEAVILEEYVSADAITGIRNVKICFNGICTSILSGVNESDSYELVDILKKFLELPNLQVIENIY